MKHSIFNRLVSCSWIVLTYSYWSEKKPSAEAMEAIKAGEEGVAIP